MPTEPARRHDSLRRRRPTGRGTGKAYRSERGARGAGGYRTRARDPPEKRLRKVLAKTACTACEPARPAACDAVIGAEAAPSGVPALRWPEASGAATVTAQGPVRDVAARFPGGNPTKPLHYE